MAKVCLILRCDVIGTRGCEERNNVSTIEGRFPKRARMRYLSIVVYFDGMFMRPRLTNLDVFRALAH